MRTFWRAIGVPLAVAMQLLGSQLLPTFPLFFDLPLLPVLLVAAGGEVWLALVLGVAAGLATDAASGGLFGLHGFADTLAGYAVAVLARRVLLRGSGAISLAVAVGAALKQACLVVLAVLLFASPEPPSPLASVLTVVTTTLFALTLHLLLRRPPGEASSPRVADLRLP